MQFVDQWLNTCSLYQHDYFLCEKLYLSFDQPRPWFPKNFKWLWLPLALWHVSRYFFAPCHSQITNPSPVISYHFHADTDWLLENSMPLYLLHSLVLLHWQKERQNLRWWWVCQLNSLVFFQILIHINLHSLLTLGPTKWVSWDETGYGAPETQHAPVVHAMSHSVFKGVLNVFIYGNDGYIHHIWQTTCDKVPNPWGWCTWSIWYKISNKIPESVSSDNPLSIGTNIHLGIEVWGCVWVAVVNLGEPPPPLIWKSGFATWLILYKQCYIQ